MLKIIVYSDPVKNEEGVITEPSREKLKVFFNKEDVLRATLEQLESEPTEDGTVATSEQLIIYMKYKVKDFRRTYKKKPNGQIHAGKDGKPQIVVEEVEDYDMYHVTDPAQIEYLLGELSV